MDNSWYSYNFILPVWNQVDTSKAIAYGTKNHMRASLSSLGRASELSNLISMNVTAQNFLVVISWVIVAGVGLALMGVRHHRTQMKQAAKKD